MLSSSRKFFPPLLMLSCGLALCFAPVFAQSNNPVANAATLPAPASAQPVATEAQIPSWIPLAAILGPVLGLAGLGLGVAGMQQKSRMEQRVRTIAQSYEKLNASVSSLETTAVRFNNLEEYLCQILNTPYDANAGMGFSLTGALQKQNHSYFGHNVEPQLKATGQAIEKTRADLGPFVAHVKQLDGELKAARVENEQRASALSVAFEQLDARTRDELETFVFNIYNLVFTQSEGDPVGPRLQERVGRFETMLSELRSIQPDEITRLTMREFDETLDQLAQKLREARVALSTATGVTVEALPYLEEKDRARAGILLEEQRKKMRFQTASARENLDALRDAAIELAKPLQTLWMGASVPDPDKPERNERCHALLLQIKAILERAGVQVYQPQIGGQLDPAKANHRFAGASHEAPFIVQKVVKLGLQVEDRIEPGAVVVA